MLKICKFLGILTGLIQGLASESAAVEVRVTADSTRRELRDAPNKVVDGSVANSARWVSDGKRGATDGSEPHWLILDFDQPLEFDQVRLLSGCGNHLVSALRDYTIDVDRDDQWVEVVRASGNRSLDVTHTIPGVKTHRVRINVRQGAIEDSFARIKEIRLYHRGKQIVPPQLDGQRRYFAAPPIVGQEDEFCRRAYRIMLRGAAFAKDLYHEWPAEPRCGYLGWGGHGEKEIFANIGMAHLYAMLIRFGQYDEKVTGVSRSEALRRIEGVVRYCCYTHFSGSQVCVDGDTWGGGWHDSSWSTVLAHMVWLVWSELDEPTQEMAARVVAAEADRFIDRAPPSGKIDNTKAEENAWNTRATAIASVMFPQHPHAEQWRTASQRWMMNCLSVAADKEDSTVVVGRPVSQWVALGVVLLLFAAPAFAGVGEGAPGELKVGFSQLDITPPVGAIMTGPRLPVSIGTDDPLSAKTLVVQSGDRTLAIVGLDLVKIRLDLADAAIAEASQRTGIDRDAVMICPSHNHSSPFIPMGGPNNKDYISTLPGLIADSIEQAYKALQPARMFLGRSLVCEGHHNRRVVSKADGLALNTWLNKLNDIKQTPQVLGTEGPIDPELWVARFDALDGRVLGTLVNFTCHPALHDRIRLKTWSADFPGVIAEQMAEAYGKQAVCVFTQGAAGNINPSALFIPDWREKAAVFARAAVEAAKRATPVEGLIAVGYARRGLVVPCRDPADQREGAIARLGWRPDAFDAAKRQAARMPKTRKVPVNAGRIGPLGIATNAGELFVEWRM